MPRALAWEDLWDCPRKRPYWCSHPHCLWCNWDVEDSDEWGLAAFLGPTLPYERYYHPRFPEANYIQDRRYVAWLCEECATDAKLVRWFASLVRRYYPWVLVVQFPGTTGEKPFSLPPPAPASRIWTAHSSWKGFAITNNIRKGPPPLADDREEGGDA